MKKRKGFSCLQLAVLIVIYQLVFLTWGVNVYLVFKQEFLPKPTVSANLPVSASPTPVPVDLLSGDPALPKISGGPTAILVGGPVVTPSVTVTPTVPSPTETPSPLTPGTAYLPVSQIILPPCGPGEQFILTVDGKPFSLELTAEGKRSRRYHPGLDGTCRKGKWGAWLATAISDARVVKVYPDLIPNENTPDNPSLDLWSSGRTVIIAFVYQGREFQAIYGHLVYPGRDEVWPKEGDTIKSGDPLGRIGSTGASTGLHLHLCLRILGADGQYHFVNPADYGVMGTRP